MKKVIDKTLAKKIILNLAKLRKQHEDGSIRVIQNKEGEIYFICHANGMFKVYDAVELKECGSAMYEIEKKNGTIFANLIRVKVDSKYQKSTIGTQLMRFIEHEMKKKGVKQISLLANVRALGDWYTKLGYTQITYYPHIKNTMIKTHLKFSKKINFLSEVIDDKTQENLLTPRFSFLPGSQKRAKILERSLDETCS